MELEQSKVELKDLMLNLELRDKLTEATATNEVGLLLYFYLNPP